MVFDKESQILDTINEYAIIIHQIFAVEEVIGC